MGYKIKKIEEKMQWINENFVLKYDGKARIRNQIRIRSVVQKIAESRFALSLSRTRNKNYIYIKP
jgi:hypothetical protein